MMRLIGDKVLVALQPKQHEQDTVSGYSYKPEDVTPSGLILATRADAYDPEVSTRGIVMQLGDKRGLVDLDDVRVELYNLCLSGTTIIDVEWADIDAALSRLGPTPFDVAVGDCVIFPASAGSAFERDGISYVILAESDIVGVLEPVKSEAAA